MRKAEPKRWHLIVTIMVVAFTMLMHATPPAHADWQKDAVEAAKNFAEAQKNELIKEQSKTAILALYKRLYSTGVKTPLARRLAETAMSVDALDKFAQEAADGLGSGDPDKIRATVQKVQLTLGSELTKFVRDPQLRIHLGTVLGSADKVGEISEILGGAAGSSTGRQKAMEYAGETLIGLSPVGGAMGFFQSAHGAMKYVKAEFEESEVEALYKAYKNRSAESRQFLIEYGMNNAGSAQIVRDRKIEMEKARAELVADASDAMSAKLRDRLIRVTDEDILKDIVATFEGRLQKERAEAAAATEIEKALKEAQIMLGELKDVQDTKHGRGKWEKSQSDLKRFTSTVSKQLNADGVLDPHNPVHIKAMADLLSTAMVNGRDSKSYADKFAKLNELKEGILKINTGAPKCGPETKRLAASLWKKGLSLKKQGNKAAAIPILKQSLEFCPNEERSTYLASLEEPEPTVAVFNGAYTGSVTFTAKPNKGEMAVSLTLNIKDGAVTGSMTSRYQYNSEGGSLTFPVDVKAEITGTVSSDGRITATIKGACRAVRPLPVGPGALLLTLVTDYPFLGENKFTGQIAEGRGEGSFTADRPQKPSQVNKGPSPENNKWVFGKWKVTRK